jgi:hypothetical protein
VCLCVAWCSHRYLAELLGYLSGYLERVHPLLDQEAMAIEVQKNFKEKWSQSNFPGWRVRAAGSGCGLPCRGVGVVCHIGE